MKWSDFLAETDVLEIYDWRAGKVLFRVDRKSRLTEPVLSPDGRTFAFGDERGLVRFWDVKSGREVSSFKAHSGELRKLIFTADGKRLVTVGRNGQVKVWKTEEVTKP